MGKTTECFFNIINEKNTFNVYVHQHKGSTNSLILQHLLEGSTNSLKFSSTNQKEAPTPCEHQLTISLPRPATLICFQAPTWRRLWSPTINHKTVMNIKMDLNCDHCWKLHQTTDSITLPNHYQNHCWSLHCAKLCYNSIWSHLTKPLLGFQQKLLGFLHIIYSHHNIKKHNII